MIIKYKVSLVAGLCHFVFLSFRGEKTKRRKTGMQKKRKDEKTPCEKSK